MTNLKAKAYQVEMILGTGCRTKVKYEKGQETLYIIMPDKVDPVDERLFELTLNDLLVIRSGKNVIVNVRPPVVESLQKGIKNVSVALGTAFNNLAKSMTNLFKPNTQEYASQSMLSINKFVKEVNAITGEKTAVIHEDTVRILIPNYRPSHDKVINKIKGLANRYNVKYESDSMNKSHFVLVYRIMEVM